MNETLQFILTNIGGPALISTIILTLMNRFFSKRDKSEDKKDATSVRFKKIETSIEEIEQRQLRFEADLKEKEKLLKAVDDVMVVLSSALRALLRDKIIDKYNYHMEKEFMPIHDRESLDSMVKEYKNLGGNGVLNEIVDKLYELPTELKD